MSASSSSKQFDSIKFTVCGGHVELQKQIRGKAYHLSWPSWEARDLDFMALLDLRQAGISLPDLLAGLKKGEDKSQLVNIGERGAIIFETFCTTVFEQFRGRMPSWKWEKKRLEFILKKGIFKGRDLHTIRDFEIRTWFNDYSGRSGVTSDNSRANMLKVMRAIFRIAAENRYLKDDPSKGIPLPAVPESQSRALTHNEAIRLYHAAEEVLRPWILLTLFTGLRPSEIVKLTVARVDLAERKITVIGTGTAKNRRRDLYIHDDLLPFVEERASAVSNLPLLREGSQRAEFPRCAYDRARKKANLMDVPFYFLRHTFATWLLDTGTESEKTRMYLMGHKDKSVNGRYTHVAFPKVREAISRLPSILQAKETLKAVPAVPIKEVNNEACQTESA